MGFSVNTVIRFVAAIGVGCAFAASASLAQGMPPASEAQLARQWETYGEDSVSGPVEFAPMRVSQEAVLEDSLHPGVNRWYLLEATPAEGRAAHWHLENSDAKAWFLSLADGALVIDGLGERYECRPWEGELATAAKSGLPYAPVCGGRVYLRNKVSGSRTNREAVSDFLRNNVIFGDKLVNLIKGTFFEDAFFEDSAFGGEADDNGVVVGMLGTAHLDRRPVMRTSMDLPVTGAPNGMEAGSWYVVEGQDGVFASVVKPGLIAEEITTVRNGANWLDGTERNADVYLVAFDLTKFEIGYELGTDHPGLGWSSRPRRSGREWNMPGPDGFNRPDPLVFNGMLNPSLMPRVVAAFAGGFKRDHGAFKYSDYANLATLYVTVDGEVGMKTWEEADNAMIPRLAYARQNGVSLVERDPETGATVPGPLVTSWGGGNWSGSAEANLRTLRSGACLREVEGRQILMYGYFSSVTPSGMARIFQAYDCDYGMLLDMNSPELTYMAAYRQNESGDGLEADHLSRYMAESDPWLDGGRVPRFVTFSDNRDFIYLLRKE